MKKLALFLAFVLMAGFAFAQAPAEEEVVYGTDKHKVVTNHFWDNWFVQIGGGAQVYYGDHNKQMAFGDRLSLALDAGFGKWFSPQIGVRAMISGLSIKGATHGSAHRVSADEYIVPEHALWEQQFDFYNIHADVLFNMSSILLGYKADRTWNCSPYLGLGWMATWESPRARQVSLNFGIFNAIRLSDKFDFNIDLRTTMVKDDFDGEVGGRKEEGLWTATFGFSYKFKKRGWDREKTVIRNNRAEADALQKQLDALRAENKALKDAPVVEKVIKEVETSSVIAPVLVLFEIGKADLSNEGRVTLGLVAKAIKDSDKPNVTFTIAGYADEGTGSKRLNEELSAARAKAVYQCLTEEYGVNEEQLRIVSKGGVDNMFYDDPRLSRAVIMGESQDGTYDIHK